MDFFAELARVKPRPWRWDNLDALAGRLDPASPAYRKAILFADNAGADAVLGVLPFARHLAGLGVPVILAATDHFALNDIMRMELDGVLTEAAALDDVLADHAAAGRIRTVGTGHTHPLIDLSDISDECATAAADCDLVVLEGMGRAVESNWQAAFRCDCLRVAMVKNVAVARHYECDLFDLVCRLDEGVNASAER
jgi:type II pantothenate kinase